jgi:hypothetical protein
VTEIDVLVYTNDSILKLVGRQHLRVSQPIQIVSIESRHVLNLAIKQFIIPLTILMIL